MMGLLLLFFWVMGLLFLFLLGDRVLLLFLLGDEVTVSCSCRFGSLLKLLCIQLIGC